MATHAPQPSASGVTTRTSSTGREVCVPNDVRNGETSGRRVRGRPTAGGLNGGLSGAGRGRRGRGANRRGDGGARGRGRRRSSTAVTFNGVLSGSGGERLAGVAHAAA